MFEGEAHGFDVGAKRCGVEGHHRQPAGSAAPGRFGHKVDAGQVAEQRLIEGKVAAAGPDAGFEHGELAAACSTGGVLFKRPGRVGDSPLPGAGYYAAAGLGAACATGTGEFILRQVACHALLLRVQAGLPVQAAAQAVCDEVAAMDPRASCGLIAIDPSGEVAVACRSEHMSHAIARGDAAIVADVRVRAG